MNQEKNHVEIFSEDSIITLYDDQQTPIDFYEVASVEYEEKFYEILQPVERIEGIDEDEAVIFEFNMDEENGEKLFKPVFDEKLLEAVFSLYLQSAADSEMTHGCGCEGGCGGGEGGCSKAYNDSPDDVMETVAKEVEAQIAEKKPAKKSSASTTKKTSTTTRKPTTKK